MNENEEKNNISENNVDTPVESAVTEKTVSVSNPEVAQINEPEMVPSELEVTTPVVETPVVQETVVSETTPAKAVEEHSVNPQVNDSTVTGGPINKKSNKGLITIIIILLGVILLVVGLVLNNGTENTNGEGNKTNDKVTVDGTLIEDVKFSGYVCMGEECVFTVELKDGNYVDYNFSGPNLELVQSLSDYKNYIKVNIYVTGEDENVTIVNYELFDISTNTKIDGVTTEAELRTVIGLYNVGTHTGEFTLVEIGTVGVGFGDNSESYTYRNYELTDEKGFEYEMKYINPGAELGTLVEGNKYTVTFEVVKGTFDYEYTIKEIK